MGMTGRATDWTWPDDLSPEELAEFVDHLDDCDDVGDFRWCFLYVLLCIKRGYRVTTYF